MPDDVSRNGNHPLSAAARDLQAATATEGLLERIVTAAVGAIESCAHASVVVEYHRRLHTLAASDSTALELDELQFGGQRGPSVDVVRGSQAVVSATDLSHDIAWGRFGPEAAERGVPSMLVHRLSVGSSRLGALSLYGAAPGGFTDADNEHATVLCALASLAMSALHHENDASGLRRALQTRDLIGQAKGILMEREDLDEGAAFRRLRVSSQRLNVKLTEIARRVVANRDAHVRA